MNLVYFGRPPNIGPTLERRLFSAIADYFPTHGITENPRVADEGVFLSYLDGKYDPRTGHQLQVFDWDFKKTYKINPLTRLIKRLNTSNTPINVDVLSLDEAEQRTRKNYWLSLV